MTHSLNDYSTLLKNTTIQQPERLVTTFAILVMFLMTFAVLRFVQWHMISEKQEWVLSYIFQKFRQCKMRSSIKIRRLFCRKLNQTWIVVGRPGLEEKEERELIKESSARFRLPRLTNKRFALSFRQSKNIGSFAIIAISRGGLFPPSIFVPQTT